MIITVSKNRQVTGKNIKTLRSITEGWEKFIQDFQHPREYSQDFTDYFKSLSKFYILESKKSTLTTLEKAQRKVLKNEIDALKFCGGFYFGGTFEGNTRGNAVTSKSLVTLDIDEIEPDIDFLRLVTTNDFLKQYEYIIHTTAKHIFPNHQRYRLIIPLEEALTEDIALKYECIARHVANTIMDISKFDKTAFDDTHLMLYPIVAQNTPPKYYTYYHNETKNFLNPQKILSQYNYHDRYTFQGVERSAVRELPPTPQKLYTSSSDLITSRDKDNLRVLIAQELQENNISVPDVTSTKKFGCVCGSSDACNFGRGYVCNCFSSNHDIRLGKRGNGVYTYDIFDLYAYTHNLDTSRDFIKICYELSRKYNITLENSEQVERFLYKPTAIDGFQGVRNNTTVAHHNGNGNNSTSSNAPELPPVPEITPENITSSGVLSYMLSLHTEIDILNYIQLLKDKAREYKKLKDVEALCNAYKKEAFKRLEEQERAEKTPEQAPDWVYLDEKNKIKIDEDKYCIYKSNQLGIRTINGRILTINGELEENRLENLVYTDIKRYINQDLAPRTKKLVSAIKIQSYSPQITHDGNIHLLNGVYNVASRNFENKMLWCVNRLNANYNSHAPRPTKWLNFLEELLEPDDIITLQEYLGYCLIPSTKAQKMLLIIGAGGEGKSVIGDVITALLGNENISADKLHQLQENRFKIANCENKLLFIDDDMKFKALEDTGEIKTIVTGGRTTIERKGLQGYDVKLYSRILCFGNGSLSSLYDHSDGFYRRQIIINTKPKDTNRIDNPYLSDDIINVELEGVLLWCIDGLNRLLDHNYKIFISQASIQALEDSKSSVMNVIEWLKQSDEVEYNPNYEETSIDIYAEYCDWCYNNALTPLKNKTVLGYLKDHATELGIKFDFNIIKSGKRARGFKGIRLMHRIKYQ